VPPSPELDPVEARRGLFVQRHAPENGMRTNQAAIIALFRVIIR
jgi:hypothetical protein